MERRNTMKHKFSNRDHIECVFTDEGISLYSRQQLIHFPYGALESIRINSFGMLQIPYKDILCAFEVNQEDLEAVNRQIILTRERMKDAEKAEMQLIDLSHKDPSLEVDCELQEKEQFRQYRIQFLQGLISPEEYHARKIQLT